MGKYILVYENNIPHDEGGGVCMERFEKEVCMHNRVSELHHVYDGNINVLAAGHFSAEYIYKPVTYVTKMVPERI